MTPVDMAKDPHSAEGYYEMTWFYGNSFNTAMLERYPAIYSTSKSEMPQSSSIGTKYHKINIPVAYFFCTIHKSVFKIKIKMTGLPAMVAVVEKIVL